MPPQNAIPLSPAELSYLHTSLSSTPPIRPDGRSPTQFRPLVAETDILPTANGSARVSFADGTEAVVGVKAEVESTVSTGAADLGVERGPGDEDGEEDGGVRLDVDMDADVQGGAPGAEGEGKKGRGRDAWLEIAIDIPGLRDDDALPIFLASMLSEALLADGELKDRLWMNRRFHWRLYIDILLLSTPLSYPLPLLSLTTHLALLSTRLPRLVSEKDEDPLFDDDWEASTFLYPRAGPAAQQTKPPITLLVMTAGSNILFDPSREELAAADSVLAISATAPTDGSEELKLVSLRTIDPPSRLTGAGVPQALNATTGTTLGNMSATEATALREKDQGRSVWRPPRGGVKREMVVKMIKMVVEKGGMGREVLDGIAGFQS